MTPTEITELCLVYGVRRFLEITERHHLRSFSKPEGFWPNTMQIEHEVSCIRSALGDVMTIDRQHVGKIIAYRFGKKPILGRNFNQLKAQLQ